MASKIVKKCFANKDDFLRILWRSYADVEIWFTSLLVWVPPVYTGAAPSWGHTAAAAAAHAAAKSAAHAAAKSAAWPFSTALGARTVTQDPTGGWR